MCRTWLIAAALWSALTAWGQDYPSRAVRIIVPFAAGGPADVYGRFIAQRLQTALGQPFVVENKPGAGALTGTQEAAQAAPDGHTLLMMSNTHTVNETLIANRPYQLMRDFAPVAPVNYSDLVLVVHPSVPVANLGELLALARSKPGQLNYASSGPGTPYHMAGELFKSMAGIDVVHVPYKGSSGARTDVLAGHVQMMFDAVTAMAPQVQSGKVKALATTGRTRSSILPDVPTVTEAGVPGYEAVIWLGLMAPAKTPPAVLRKLNAEVARIVASPEVAKEWAAQGATTMTMSIEEFDRYLRADIDKWAQIVRKAGIKAEN
ncbi:MAG TPA: tripartite tricarboxylate transporter substrate binding protein [Burkholderiaceae bacterium]|nr:tripartite tricarboxylate transporter substrate binding protein [Burkholderiaceae bacterium]